MNKDLEDIKKELAIDKWVDFIRNNPHNFSAWRSLSQYIDILENQLQQRDSVIEEAIKFIDDACYISGTKMPNGLGNKNVRKLLDILNKYKKEESE